MKNWDGLGRTLLLVALAICSGLPTLAPRPDFTVSRRAASCRTVSDEG